ncbi:MAG: PKD domain-containing protein [Flavobacteriia bacterium]|nr:PKD domain-containing protein [Flavobacteriia bacterium]
MKKNSNYFMMLLLFILIILSNFSYSQQKTKQNLNTVQKKFELNHSYFVENIGQDTLLLNSPILYTARMGELTVYFTQKGFVFEKRDYGDKEEQHERKEKIEKGEKVEFYSSEFLYVDFANADPSILCLGEKKETFYYSYENSLHKFKSDKATCFRKILYQNVYAGIDFEFTINDDGIKYTILLKPGADPSKIKLEYRGLDSIQKDKVGDLILTSNIFNLKDHSPITIDEDSNQLIGSEFIINGNTVSFSIDSYNPDHSLIIDPWITNTNPVGGNYFGSDIDYDNLGNVYVFVSQYNGFGTPMNPEVWKYNSSGVFQWAFVSPAATYGDMTVNRVNGEVYCTAGQFGPGTQAIWRLNTLGIVMNTYTTAADMSDPMELWRAKYDHCNNQLIIGSGGEFPFVQGAFANASLTSLTGVNMVGAPNGNQDVCNLVFDPDGTSCYMQIALNVFGSPTATNFDNAIVKVPLIGLSPTIWQVLNTNTYAEYGNNYNQSGGFNGMACSWNYLYTYDGTTLKQWNKTTGALVNFVALGGTQFQTSGIDVTPCGDIYVGVNNQLKVFDENLTQINTIPLGGTCYDLILGNQNKLYACGDEFVQEIQLNNPLILTQTPENCGQCDGTATVNGCTNINSLNIIWMPGGQTTPTATGLCEGWHTVTISGECTSSFSMADSVFVTSLANCSLEVTSNSDTVCVGGCVDLVAQVTNNVGAVAYQWDNGITNTTAGPVTVCPIVTTTYMIIATDDAGFSDTTYSIVTVLPIPIVNLGNDTSFCGTSLLLDAENPGLDFQWQNGSTNQTYTATTSGLYWVNVSNEGCISTDSINVTINTPININLPNDTNLCEGATLVLNAQNSGASYLWNDNSTNQTLSVNQDGDYWVTVTSGLCNASDTINVTFYEPISLFSTNDTIGCAPLSVIFSDQSTTPYDVITDWLWNFGDGATSTSQNPVHIYSTSGIYTVNLNVVTNQGCSDDSTMTNYIEVYPLPSASFIVDPENPDLSHPLVSFTNTSTDAVSWHWDFGDGMSSDEENPEHTYSAANTYTVTLTVTNAFGCTSSIDYYLIVTAVFNFYCPNAFTPDGFGANDLFGGAGEGIDEFNMQIFDRWGELIFETDDLDQKWDGTFKGKKAQDGVYTWKVSIKSKEPKYYDFIGHVSVLR